MALGMESRVRCQKQLHTWKVRSRGKWFTHVVSLQPLGRPVG